MSGRIINLSGPTSHDISAATIQFTEDLQLLRCFPLYMSFVPLKPLVFNGSKWDIIQAIKARCSKDSLMTVDVDLSSKTSIKVTARFSTEEALKSMTLAVKHKTFNASGALLMGDVVSNASTKRIPSKALEYHTIVLSGVPAKWVESGENGSTVVCRKLMNAMRGFGPVHRIETDAESALDLKLSSNIDDLLSNLPSLNLTIWVKFESSSAFKAALEGLSRRVICRKGVETFMPLTVEPDTAGYLTDEQCKIRKAERIRVLKEQEQVSYRYENQKRILKELRDELVRADSSSKSNSDLSIDVSSSSEVISAFDSAQSLLLEAESQIETWHGAAGSSRSIDRLLEQTRSKISNISKEIECVRVRIQSDIENARREALRKKDEEIRLKFTAILQQALSVLPIQNQSGKSIELDSQVTQATSDLKGYFSELLEACFVEGGSKKLSGINIESIFQTATGFKDVVILIEKRIECILNFYEIKTAVENDNWLCTEPSLLCPPINVGWKWEYTGAVDIIGKNWDKMKHFLEAEMLLIEDFLSNLRSLLMASGLLKNLQTELRIVEEYISKGEEGLATSEIISSLLTKAQTMLISIETSSKTLDSSVVFAQLHVMKDAVYQLQAAIPEESIKIKALREERERLEMEKFREETAKAIALANAEAKLRAEVEDKIIALNRAKAFMSESVRTEQGRDRVKKIRERLKKDRDATKNNEAIGPHHGGMAPVDIPERKRKRARLGPSNEERWQISIGPEGSDFDFEKGSFKSFGGDWWVSMGVDGDLPLCPVPSKIIRLSSEQTCKITEEIGEQVTAALKSESLILSCEDRVKKTVDLESELRQQLLHKLRTR